LAQLAARRRGADGRDQPRHWPAVPASMIG
jgi:hypothetical protein